MTDDAPLRVRTRDRSRWGLIANGADHVLWNDGATSPINVDALEEVTEACPFCAALGAYHGLCLDHWLALPYQVRAPFWDGDHDEGMRRAAAFYKDGDAMKLTKATKDGVCAAMRCTEASKYVVDGAPWGLARAELCDRHYGQAIAAFGSDAIKVVQVDAVPSPPSFMPPLVDAPLPTVKAPIERHAYPIVTQDDLKAEEAEAIELIAVARVFTIDTREELETAAEVLAEVKGKLKKISERKEEITRPLNAALRSARDLFRPLENHYSEVESAIKGAIGAWHLKETEANRRAVSDAADAHAAGDASGVATALAKVGTVKNTPGITAYTKWDFVIEDESALPREFLCPNETLIREACNHSTDREPTPIPGVRFFPKPVVSSRTR